MLTPADAAQRKQPPSRVASVHSMGWCEDGRLGLGPPPGGAARPNGESHGAQFFRIPESVDPEIVPSLVGSTGGVVFPRPLAELGDELAFVDVAAGAGNHCLAVREDGVVFGFGSGKHGQLGGCFGTLDELEGWDVERAPPTSWSPIPMPPLPRKSRNTGMGVVEAPIDPIVSAAVSHKSSFVLTQAGRVWGWGSGARGVLGGGETGEDFRGSVVPVMMKDPLARQSVTQISAGFEHVMALTMVGRGYAWGRNDDGQLGCGRRTEFEPPRQMKLPNPGDRVTYISAGYAHSLAVIRIIRADDRVEHTAFAWGNPANGRLGAVNAEKSHTPQEVWPLIKLFRKYKLKGVKMVAAGRAHSLAVTDEGRVVAWGEATFGQLGTGDNWDNEMPAVIPNLSAVIHISAGASQTLAISSPLSAHTLKGKAAEEAAEQAAAVAAAEDPDAYEEGKAAPTEGEGKGEDEDEPLKRSLPDTLWAWGYNCFGELGLGDERPRLQPTMVKTMLPQSVTRVSTGCRHTLICTGGVASRVRDSSE